MPTVRSICQGGIWCSMTRVLIERAHGRVSANVISDIGAIEFGRWHASHLSWKIGAMSLVKVGVFGASAAVAIRETPSTAPSTHAPNVILRACAELNPIMSMLPARFYFTVTLT